MKLKLYRGITLAEKSVKAVIDEINENGIVRSDESLWSTFQICDIKKQIPYLITKQDLSRQDTYPEINITNDYTHGDLINAEDVMCFADKVGAEFYAKVHNKTVEKNVPILIEIEIDIDKVSIDGRDFLYTCFQLMEKQDLQKQQRQINKILSVFGKSIEKYLIKASQSNDMKYILALCDLAVQDNDVISEHYQNEILIGGRYKTIFKSSFFVKIPVEKRNIISVRRLENDYFHQTPKLTLDSYFER